MLTFGLNGAKAESRYEIDVVEDCNAIALRLVKPYRLMMIPTEITGITYLSLLFLAAYTPVSAKTTSNTKGKYRVRFRMLPNKTHHEEINQ